MKPIEAAQRLEISKTTLYHLIATGALSCYRVGSGRGSIRLSDSHIAQYLSRVEQPAKPLGGAPSPDRMIQPPAVPRKPVLRCLNQPA